MEIRKATHADVEVLYEWANSEAVRANAFSKTHIPFSDHKAWFEKKIASKNSHIYLGIVNDIEVGQVRFERIDSTSNYIIDIHVSPDRAGNGYGSKLLELAIKELRQTEKPYPSFEAIVFDGNLASQRCFLKNGFTLAKEDIIKGIRCHTYKLIV